MINLRVQLLVPPPICDKAVTGESCNSHELLVIMMIIIMVTYSENFIFSCNLILTSLIDHV